MLNAIVCGLIVGCTEPSEVVRSVRPELTVTQAGHYCRLVRFTITSDTTVTPDYPDNGCAGSAPGLVARKLVGAPITWSTANGRTLTIPVRIENRTTGPIQLPIRVELQTSGKKVLIPLETSNTTLMPANNDSTLANGVVLWLVGGTGTLAGGDTSAVRNIVFTVDTPVVKGEFQFLLKAEEGDTARPAIPSEVQWPATALTVQFPADTSLRYRRDVYKVMVDPAMSGPDFRALLATFGATVIGAGGGSENDAAPMYYLLVPDPGPSWTAVDSIATSMRGATGVISANPVGYAHPPKIRSRYPEELTYGRQNWSSGDSLVQPWIAIRAPQAWGCQTGAGIATPVKVGVIDAYNSGISLDLLSSLTTARVRSPTSLQVVPVPDPRVLHHGAMVANILSGEGDNSIGATGSSWRTEMYMWTLGVGSGSSYQYSTDQTGDYARWIRDAKAKGVQVLNLSMAAGEILDDGDVRMVLAAAIDYLSSDARRMIVYASGNDGLRPPNVTLSKVKAPFFDPKAVPYTVDSTLVLSGIAGSDRAMAALHESSTYGNQVVLVSATNRQGTLSDSSNAFGGSSAMVAAPGDTIQAVVGLATPGFLNNTSAATPIVSGLAVLLWAADPSLTAADVKDYIVRGSKAARPDSTGALVTPGHVGVVGTHQIDMYSSLTLLSRERSGTPICGVEVRRLSGDKVAIMRDIPDTLTRSDSEGFGIISVAQGGRQFAITSRFAYDGQQATDVFSLGSGGQWTRSTKSGTFAISYLERDTAYLRAAEVSGREQLFVRIGSDMSSRNVSEVNVAANAPSGPDYEDWSWVLPAVSPTGDYILLNWLVFDGQCASRDTYAFRLRGTQSLASAHAAGGCAGAALEGFGYPAWRPDGSSFLIVAEGWHFDTLQVHRRNGVTPVSLGTQAPLATVPGPNPRAAYWDPAGPRAWITEYSAGACQLSVRSLANWSLLSFTANQCNFSVSVGPTFVMDAAAQARASEAAPEEEFIRRRRASLAEMGRTAMPALGRARR